MLGLDETTLKARIIGYFRAEGSDAKSARIAKKVVTEKMADFADKKQFARKKTDTDKRLVTYEFSRLPAAYQAELNAAVRAVIARMQAETKAE